MTTRITEDEVRRVATLSRLRLSDAEVRTMANELSAVLGYMSKLNELNVDGVEPMAHAMELRNVLREDEPWPGLTVEQVLANAPDSETPFFKVPKVLGDSSGA